ncbi:S8 family peptidase, partial [[Clostridium] scindens]
IRKSLEFQMPVAINISFGNTYGPHDGTSLLERFIDDISNIWKNSICIGTGNEAASAGHTSGMLREDEETIIQLAVQNSQPALNIQIWKEYTDVVDISIVNPSGVAVGPFKEILGPQRYTTGQTEILLYYGEPSPYSTSQEIYIDMIPRDGYISGGIWQIVLSPRRIVSGEFEMWLPSESVLNQGTGFLFPTDSTTLTIPSTASRAISVGAYNALTFSYADFSGRGYTREQQLVKPDIVAPGVSVTSVMVGGGYGQFTGTSFATPFVTGGAALLMEWGIVRGNDNYLYGEKVKAYLRRGARPLPGFTQYPNPQVGYGALCVRDSLPI